MSKDPRKPQPSRRSALKGMGAAAMTPLIPGCEPAPAVSPGTVDEAITHVVYLMMENRSFDHYFGSYSLLEGRADIDGLEEGMSNPRADGTEVEIHPAEQFCVEDPPHSWDASHEQWNEGANDGFVRVHEERHGSEVAHRPMGYFGRDTLSALYTLADNYVLCERWFQSLMSSTWPNRFYSLAAQSNGVRGNDPGGDYEMPTIIDRLRDAGVPWGNYYGTAPFMLLLPNHWSEETNQPFERFDAACEFGFLPEVTILDPFYGRNDDHPPTHPVAGEILIASIYESLISSQYKDNFILFITYDEHGGFFDHVSPPLMADQRADEGFDQAGFRVPSLVIGPWVKAAHLSDVVYDHSSVLAFIERRFGLEPLTMRDEAAADLYDELDMDRIADRDPLPAVTLPVIEADEDEIYAPECSGGGISRDGAVLSSLGQPELEAFLDALPERHPADLRHVAGERYEAFLDFARGQGVWRPRG